MKTSTSTVHAEIDRICYNRAKKWSSDLTSQGSIVPTMHQEISLSKIVNWREFRMCCVLSWYLPEEIQGIVQAILYERVNKYGADKVNVALTLLRSKPEMRLALIREFRHPREIFGELHAIHHRHIRLYFVKPFPRRKKTDRIRGYRDHGSKRPDHKWLPLPADAGRHQQELEEYRQSLKDTEEFLRGWEI